MKAKKILMFIFLFISMNTIKAQTTLTYFNVAQVFQYIDLTWGTPSEMNMDYYEIERSIDSVTYSTVLIVQAVGNTSSNSSYVRTDSSAFADTCYFYRIKAVEFGGTYTYLDTVKVCYVSGTNSISKNDEGIIFSLYPNPVNSECNIDLSNVTFKNNLTMEIYNSLGEIIETKTIANGSGIVNFSTTNFNSGIYFVKLNDGKNTAMKKIVKQ